MDDDTGTEVQDDDDDDSTVCGTNVVHHNIHPLSLWV